MPLGMDTLMTPQQIEDQILNQAMDMFTLTCIEGGIEWPEEVVRSLVPPIMRTAIRASREYYQTHVAQLANLQERCNVCDLPVGMWEMAMGGGSYADVPFLPERVARPCGHAQQV